MAAVVVGSMRRFANYYASSGLGDLGVVLLLGVVLFVRPAGLSGSFASGPSPTPLGVFVALGFVPRLAPGCRTCSSSG